MKISRVKAVNFMGVQNVDAVLKEGVNKITGANGAGKSSFKDSIIATLCGKQFTPAVPVRVGKNQATVEVDMGEYVVKGTYTKDRRKIEVLSKEGIPISKPQELLNKAIGKLSFDPMKFYLLTAKEQVEVLRELVGFNVDDIEARYKVVQAERAQINSNKTLIQQQVDQIEYEPDTPDEEVSIGELTGKLQETMAFNNALVVKKEQEEDRKTRITLLIAKIDSLKKEHDILQSTAIEGHHEELVPIEPIQEEISALETTNKNVRAKQKKAELQKAVDLKTNEYTDLGRTLKALDKTKAERIAEIKMPVKGLSLTREDVMFGELPLKQVNTGEQLKISVAIAMAMNPELKTVFVKANDLDDDNLKLLEDFITEKGYQGLIELADTSGEIGIVIEDGKIKGK
jgi:DNA repair ATPase RecN